ncbi:ACS family hexuronate transporter-like MFS transporter [Novosphingobium kunmingense]|uniref:ACS family hexuronate transporter-like MFS transporter n=1 Tax=Novosphingobium kunmingense TaxID=1211806 RepID=A0A2N0I3X1_9SPHN|nr:MFS transporter [Novosphingobium kunmingense]PKB25894.1 ACS family hexuronate transporter-like MFS transporter [Novosphingobium kunmingense]
MTDAPANPSARLAPSEAERILARSRKWLIALLFFGTIINYVDRQVLSLLKPTISAEYGWGDAEFAHFASASQLAAAGALLFVGWLIDRFGVRLAYGTAVGLWSLAGIAHAFAATVGQFVAARVALVAVEAVNTPAAVKAAAQYLPIKQRSMAVGIVNTAPNLGNILAPLTVVPFAVVFGWKAAFIVTGLLGFVWLAFWIAGTRRLRALPRAEAPGEGPARSSYGEALADRKTWAIMGAKAITDMFWWFFTFWLPDLFNKVFHLSQSELVGPTALAFSLAALGALTSGKLFGVLLDGRSVNAARKTSMLLYALVILPIPLALTVDSAWTAAALIGLGLFAHQGFSTNIFGFAADAIPARRVATVMALGAVAGNVAGFGIQEATGRLLTNGIGYAPLFWVAAFAYLAALGWIHLLVPRIVAEDGDQPG